MTSRPLRRTLAVLAVPGLALALAVGTLPAQAVPTPSSTPSSSAAAAADSVGYQRSAELGAGWLAAQITANGGYLAPFGAPDAGNTAYAVSAIVATGTGRDAVASATAWLKTQVADGLSDSTGADNAGALANLVLAATAAGENPRAFGGRAPENDLVARLRATIRTTGSDAGLFGAQDPTYDGAFRQGLALAALDNAGVSRRNVADARNWLTDQQCANGLWTSYREDTAVPCAAADSDTFSGPDTNSSALALQGLAATGDVPRRAAAVSSLDEIQSDDGGFPFIAAGGQASDPNSTAVTLQSLIALRAAPAGARFTVGGATPFDALQAFQLGCTDAAADRGAYYYPGSRTADVLATIQAVPAQARVTIPVPPHPLSDTVRTTRCGAGSSASTTTASTSASNTASTAAQSDAAITAAASSPSARMLGASAKKAGTAGSCSGTSGVTVAVDFKAFGSGTQVRCAPGDPTTGVAALQQAGFTPAGTTRYGLAFICRINNKPAPAQDPCANTPSAMASWSYYHASRTATTWTYSTTGASTYNPVPGAIEAWAFGNRATPTLTPAKVRLR